MNKWDLFFKESITRILKEKKAVVDIGGGLRVSKEKSNRVDPERQWILPLLEGVDYKVMDPVPDYHPDIVGDIHHMPFADNTIDAILCLAVLEHVENPILAASEMFRTLKPGGYCMVYVPFLFYYHAAPGYYKDYWRFTEDSLRYIFKDFSQIEICLVRGAVGTWLKLAPFGKYKLFEHLGKFADKILKKENSKQTSGYNIFLIK